MTCHTSRCHSLTRVITAPHLADGLCGAPDVELQQASAIVASWFGSRSGWRGQNFPVLYNQLPDRNAIVFATMQTPGLPAIIRR